MSMGTPAAPRGTGSKPSDTGHFNDERVTYRPRISPEPIHGFSRSLEYGVAILECFAADRRTLGVADLADMIGLSRSTAHRYALTLVALGRLEQDDKRKYRLAANAAQPGMDVIRRTRRERPARAILEDLRAETGHTVSMAILDGTTAIYIHRLLAHGTGQYWADGDLGVGARVPLHSTAIGRALLVSLPKGELDGLLLEMRLKPSPIDAVKTGGLLELAIERSGRDGIAFSDEEHVTGVRSLAVPVTSRPAGARLAIEISAPADACTMRDLLARHGPAVKRAAKRV